MDLQERIDLMVKIGQYFKADNEEWKAVKEQAYRKNGWFTPQFIQYAAGQLADNFLAKEKLQQWAAYYHIDNNIVPKNIGIVMAGNIPMVGFHDFLTVFISGHYQTVKLSSKDEVLLKHIFRLMYSFDIETQNYVSIAELLKGCDAYIATGSNNSGRYFEQYFGKYPNIIRRNRTSVAILTGNETKEELRHLSDDIHLYFGLGCRNVTKIYVPEEYDFVPLLDSFKPYSYFADHHKYKNNYDYQLSIVLLNNIYYMTDGGTLLIENEGFFSPIGQLHYQFYKSGEDPAAALQGNGDIQCVVGKNGIPFGEAQNPELFSYADGVDTVEFLLGL